MPTGSRMPSALSTRYSCGMACRSSRSCGMAMARATSFTRSTSARVISSPLMATTPLEPMARTCSPAMPTYIASGATPETRTASSTAARMDRVASSMSETTPRRSPIVRVCPSPRTFRRGARGRSPCTAATSAVVCAVPISRATTMGSAVMAVGRSPGHENADRVPPRAGRSAPDLLLLVICP